MGQILLFLIILFVSGWATVLVRRQGPKETGHRVFLYALSWLLPFFGPAIVGYIVLRRAKAELAAGDDGLFEAVVKARGETANR